MGLENREKLHGGSGVRKYRPAAGRAEVCEATTAPETISSSRQNSKPNKRAKKGRFLRTDQVLKSREILKRVASDPL